LLSFFIICTTGVQRPGDGPKKNKTELKKWTSGGVKSGLVNLNPFSPGDFAQHFMMYLPASQLASPQMSMSMSITSEPNPPEPDLFCFCWPVGDLQTL